MGVRRAWTSETVDGHLRTWELRHLQWAQEMTAVHGLFQGTGLDLPPVLILTVKTQNGGASPNEPLAVCPKPNAKIGA